MSGLSAGSWLFMCGGCRVFCKPHDSYAICTASFILSASQHFLERVTVSVKGVMEVQNTHTHINT